MPIVSRITGFQGYLFVDASGHLTISLYDDPSGTEQTTRDTAGWVAEYIVALIAGPPQFTAGRVRTLVGPDDVTAATPAG